MKNMLRLIIQPIENLINSIKKDYVFLINVFQLYQSQKYYKNQIRKHKIALENYSKTEILK
jgi:hypothetical protein